MEIEHDGDLLVRRVRDAISATSEAAGRSATQSICTHPFGRAKGHFSKDG